MANNIAPGVYTNIIDLNSYVQEVPSTTGLMCALTPKGRDNQLIMVTSQSDLTSEWGNPDISKFGSLGKSLGQCHYFAHNFLGESGSLYFMRCLPTDANFASVVISSQLEPTDSTASMVISYASNRQTLMQLRSSLDTLNHVHPLCVLYPLGRGEYYNVLGVRLTAHANPMISDVYILDIYERQSSGSDVIVESFEISFDPEAIDPSGNSLWISDVLETYSKLLRATMVQNDGDFSSGYTLLTQVFDRNIGQVTVTNSPVVVGGEASITDDKQNFHDWELATEDQNATFVVIAKDGFGTEIYGWLGASPDDLGNTVHVFDGRDLQYAERRWLGDVDNFRPYTTISYRIKESNTSIADAWIDTPVIPLKGGSDGSIKNSMGQYDSVNSNMVLAQAFGALLVNPITGEVEDSILDTESVGFNVIFDGGYSSDVKAQIINLAQTRRDCIAFIDNGDNASVNNSLMVRNSDNAYNTELASIYEPYNRIYDKFSGKDIWVSPIYHLSYLVPRNDKVGELWYAVAGYNRASIGSIKGMRFSPKLSQRDAMHLKQVNPIVQFNNGYVLFGQLTTQTKVSPLQDVNVVRLLLYIKKALEGYCRNYIFDQNDVLTWSAIRSSIDGFLDTVKSRRGLAEYSVEVGANDYEMRMKRCHVNVMLTPVRALEQITINLFVE